eukprot:4540884-Pyramimonas_sp.AAC.1
MCIRDRIRSVSSWRPARRWQISQATALNGHRFNVCAAVEHPGHDFSQQYGTGKRFSSSGLRSFAAGRTCFAL